MAYNWTPIAYYSPIHLLYMERKSLDLYIA